MAYTPINWQTGDTITADKLNKCDNGWSVGSTTLFNETLTTTSGDMGNSATMAYTGDPTTISTMVIVFDGTTYNCELQSFGGGTYSYGAPSPMDFSTYPFICLYMSGAWSLITETAGEHTVIGATDTVETSSDFQTAVNSFLVSDIFIAINNQTTWQAIYDAMTANRLCIVKDTGTDSVAFYMVTLCQIHNGTYEVAALYINGGSSGVRYYNANSANGAIYPA